MVLNLLLSKSDTPAFAAGQTLWLQGWLDAINNNSNFAFPNPWTWRLPCSPMLLLLGLHTTTLILVKGALDARGSKLMPDKKDFGYSFPCDGPGRGGTCDISAWDAFYLAVFWMLNTIGWVTFYFHWKHLGIWQGNVNQFNESSTYLMGWLRDYLWLNSSQLINGYNLFRYEQSFCMGLDVLVWSFNLRYWIYVPHILAWILARTYRDSCMGT